MLNGPRVQALQPYGKGFRLPCPFLPETLQAIEDIIYGTATTNPRFPTIDEIRALFDVYGILVIIDNGDGNWTAIDQAGDYITMNNPTQFTINNADATYLDATTYEVSTTYPD